MLSTEIVDASYVMDHLGKIPIVDLRPEFMFGASHVPGAENFDYWLRKMQDGPLLSDRLSQQLDEMGVGLSDPVIVMCQIGHTSAQACELLEEQGYAELRHYTGGFSDWITDSSRPVE